MLELEAGLVIALGDESDLDFAGRGRVGLDAPVRADVLAEDDSAGWFVGHAFEDVLAGRTQARLVFRMLAT